MFCTLHRMFSGGVSKKLSKISFCKKCRLLVLQDEMLFCDACDKGYHMNCHKPPVLEKPTGLTL